MNTVLHQPQHQQLGKRKRLQAEERSAAAGMTSSSKAPVQGNLRAVLTRFDANAVGYPWNDPNANTEIQAKNPGAPRLVGFSFYQCSLGGTNGQAKHDANALMDEPSRYELTSEDCSRGGTKISARAVASKLQMPQLLHVVLLRHSPWKAGQVLVPYP
jgi:hypothetical protein